MSKTISLYDATIIAHRTSWSNTAWGKTAHGYVLQLIRFIGGGQPMHDGGRLCLVTTQVLDAWTDTYKEAPSTTNRRLSAISKVFKVARQRGYTGPVPYIPWRKEAAHRTRWLSRTEETALLRELILASRGSKSHLADGYLDSDAADIAVMLLDTGMRLGEMYALSMADLDWSTDMITVHESKSGKPRSVPMTKRVKAILNTKDPKLPFSLERTEFRKRWEIARESMGMKEDQCFVPHVLRHTCASRLVQQGVHLKVVQELLGHSDMKMTMRYAHLAPENLEAAKVALESYDD